MPESREKIARKIIDWYEVNGRTDLPWRRTKNPYRILIAELMLQKTHAVQQVLPVFYEFLGRYPNMKSLSRASISDIRKTISSLGLQNIRSRRLKELALTVNKQFGGEIPKKYSDLRSLPGVGEYIANAVLCTAFDERKPMVDANFGRVLGRVFFGKEDYPPSKNRTRKIAYELLPETKFKEFNLGVIDLGALVCKPKSPLHTICPISEECRFLKRIKRALDKNNPMLQIEERKSRLAST